MSLLTEEERRALVGIGTAATAVFKLPRLHPRDNREIEVAVHVIQNIIMARPVMRESRKADPGWAARLDAGQ